jgi:hypothetical protein
MCRAGGWLVQLIVRKIWPKEADRFSTLSLSLGLVFSVLLTLTPRTIIGLAEFPDLSDASSACLTLKDCRGTQSSTLV